MLVRLTSKKLHTSFACKKTVMESTNSVFHVTFIMDSLSGCHNTTTLSQEKYFKSLSRHFNHQKLSRTAALPVNVNSYLFRFGFFMTFVSLFLHRNKHFPPPPFITPPHPFDGCSYDEELFFPLQRETKKFPIV